MIIRKSIPKDANELARIDKLAHKEKKWWTPQTAKEFSKPINKNKSLIFVAVENNTVVGYLQGGLNKKKKSISIENVYVIKSLRKKKIAKELVGRFINDWQKKIKNFELVTSDENLKIFEKMGFKKTANFMRFKL